MIRNLTILAVVITLGTFVFLSNSNAPSVKPATITASTSPQLEQSLQLIAKRFEPTLPKLYQDGTTTIIQVKAIGQTFSYYYELDTNWLGPITDQNIATTRHGNCKPDSGVRKFLNDGARIEHSYVNRNGHFLGSFFVELSNCS